jgi:hypothetical protein
VKRDSINQQDLIDGKLYHFAVTAYYYADIADLPFPVIESDPGYISIRAQKANPGYTVTRGDTIDASHSGLSHGRVTPILINPENITGHSYQISFSDSRHWHVTDRNTGEVKAENQTNLSGDYNYPVIDGILPIVSGPEYTRLSGWNSDGKRWIIGYNWGGQEFNGGLDIGHRFLGSTLDTLNLVPVRLEFQGRPEVEDNGYISTGAVYRRDRNYAFAGSGQLPLAAYDILDPENPRRLNICFCEQDSTGLYTANNIWDMAANGLIFPDDQGAHEYLFIMNSSYDGGINYNNDNNGTRVDVLFALWVKGRGYGVYLENPFIMEIEVDLANTTSDIFTYTSPNPAKVPNRFQLYQNYPNPFNNSTTIRYWLPEQNQTTLQIYDILGQKVATVVDRVQDQGEYYVQWQPGNIASGIYFYRLISGGYSKLFKMIYIR